MLLQPANFLLLDEPTNHLDIRAKDVLLEALENFTGTLVFVSHDRYFIEHLANRVFEIADGEVRIFPGNYADYLWRKAGGPLQTPTLDDVPVRVPPAEPIAMPLRQAGNKRLNPIKLKQMQEQVKGLEQHIATLEAEIQGAEVKLSDFVGAEEAMRLSALIESRRASLDGAMAEWEGLTAEIEATA
jgi:ATP-binding cassette subfamily F protein 3